MRRVRIGLTTRRLLRTCRLFDVRGRVVPGGLGLVRALQVATGVKR